MGRLTQRMPQQALGVSRHVRRKRKRSQAAQRGYVRGVGLQHLPEQCLGGPAIVSEQRRGGRLNARSVRLTLPCTLKCRPSIVVLLQINEYVAIGEPCASVPRVPLEHVADVFTGLGQASGATTGTRKIDARLSEVSRVMHDGPEGCQSLRRLVLIDEGRTQQPATIYVAGILVDERPQPALCSRRTASAQRCVCRAQSLL